MGIEPTSLAWEARVITIIRRPQRPRLYRDFGGLGASSFWTRASELAWLTRGAVASPGEPEIAQETPFRRFRRAVIQ